MVGLLGQIPLNFFAWSVNTISQYSAYKKDKKKDDDLVVRKRLESEVLKCHDHMKNVMDILHERSNEKAIESTKKVKSELEVFMNEINLAPVGHQYPFFSIQRARSPKESDIRKLVEYDGNMLYRIMSVREAMEKIEEFLIRNEDIEINTEMLEIRKYVTVSRDFFKDREEFLRRWN